MSRLHHEVRGADWLAMNGGKALDRGRYKARYADVKRHNWNWLRILCRHGSIADKTAFWSILVPHSSSVHS